MASLSLHFTKIEKLTKPQDFVQWLQRVKVFISRDDATVLSLQPEPDADVENHAEWITTNANPQSTIIICLGDSALAIKHVF